MKLIKKNLKVIILLVICAFTLASCTAGDATNEKNTQIVNTPVVKLGSPDSSLNIEDLQNQFEAGQDRIPLENLFPDSQEIAFYTADSDIIIAAVADCALHKDGTISHREKNLDLIGIMLDPPDYFVFDAARCGESFLAKGEKVLIVYLDGLGYGVYEEAKEQGFIPYLGSLDVKTAASVMPSVTVVNFASMVSGTTPKYNGVSSKADHQLTGKTIFDEALSQGLSTYLIESDIEIIQLQGEAEYNVDENGNGVTDDEIFHSAKEILPQGTHDLILIHFHGIDDLSHKYGPRSAEAFNEIKVIDQYVKDLAALWQGRVIIVSDHGQHDVTEEDGRKGNHGDFRASDLFTPIIIQ